jgi:hypothetical protein
MQTRNYQNCKDATEAMWCSKGKEGLYHIRIVKLPTGGQWKYRVYWFGNKDKPCPSPAPILTTDPSDWNE